MTYIIEQLDAAADAIRHALAEGSFIGADNHRKLRDEVLAPLNAIRSEMLLCAHDDQRGAP